MYPLEFDKYLFDYLQETDLLAKSTWFTPFCSRSSSTNDTSSYVSGALNAFCKGIPDSRVKKYN